MTQRFNFQAACTAMLRELGAVDAGAGALYPMQIQTAVGPLDLWPHNAWLACRFVDVERAKALLGGAWGGRLNPVSGKWNFHPDRADVAGLALIRGEIERMLVKREVS